MKRVFWLAGEKSGDLHASIVIQALNRRRDDLQHLGVCGPHMQQAGCTPLFDFQRFSVMGFVEVLRHISFFQKVEKQITQLLRTEPPDLVVLVDYPGLNMRIARIAKKLGIPVLYYICPQFWAWKYHRIHDLKRYTDHIAYILPFEGDHFAQHSIAATYVGHPIAQEIAVSMSREKFAAAYSLDASKRWIGVLPGSRDGEIKTLLPTFLQSVKLFDASKYEILLSRASSVNRQHFAELVQDAGCNVTIIEAHNYEIMQYSDALVATSGTATLETAFIGTPFVLAYKTSPLSYLIARHIIKIRRIGLPNIILDDDIIPELIQQDANPRTIAAHLQRLLDDQPYRQQITAKLAELHATLGTRNAAEETATVVERLLV
jgi:lipid-A-disaccharide synthase